MSFITISRNKTGHISMGGLKEDLPKKKSEPKKSFAVDAQNAYHRLINKKTNPQISQNQLDDIFDDVGLLAKK